LGGEDGSIPLFLGNLDKAALDKVPYKDFMESKKLDLGCGVPDPVALYSDSVVFEVSLKDIALLRRPALSLSKSDLMISPVDLFNSLEAFRSRLASAY
jgi:hypothetical protein